MLLVPACQCVVASIPFPKAELLDGGWASGLWLSRPGGWVVSWELLFAPSVHGKQAVLIGLALNSNPAVIGPTHSHSQGKAVPARSSVLCSTLVHCQLT